MNKQPVTACVLIADDDEDDRYLLANAFAQYSPGCQLHFDIDGQALLETLDQMVAKPNLILLDLNMPRLNGFETLAVLRGHPLYGQTPIIVLTTSDHPQDRHRAQQLGANGFVTKPMNSALLGQVVLDLQSAWLVGKCC